MTERKTSSGRYATVGISIPPPPVESVQDVSERLRVLGASLLGEAFLEDDLLSQRLLWANPYLLEKTGYSLEELQERTVRSVLPDQFHAALEERIAGKRSAYYIFPFLTKSGTITWWLANDEEEIYPRHWSRGRLLVETPSAGPDYERIALIMQLANLDGELLHQHGAELDFIKGELSRLNDSDDAQNTKLDVLARDQQALSRKVDRAAQASRDAANSSLKTNQTLVSVRQDITAIREETSKFTTDLTGEILRLLKQDATVSEQVTGLREEIARATKDAADVATTSIRDAGDAAQKRLTGKVTMPIGIVGALFVIVNHLLDHPEILGKLFLKLFGG